MSHGVVLFAIIVHSLHKVHNNSWAGHVCLHV